MYFEIYKKGNLIKRGKDILSDLGWDNELMLTPSLRLTLPIYYLDYISGREEIKVFVNDKCFFGIVTDIEVDKESETMDVDLEHIVDEWTYRQISVNNAIKDKKINVIYKEATKEDPLEGDPSVVDQLTDIYEDTNFAYPGWKLNFSDKAKSTDIDYVYSRQDKLEALTKTMELTDDLFWRVRFVPDKEIDISEFGEKKPYIISTKPSGKTNIRMISEPVIDYDFENVINLATVYSEKSDSGMSSMTLREVYNNPSLQKSGFPVVILRNNVNNERDYRMYATQYPKLAPNNELEYAVIDEASVALENGVLIEGTYAFNDLSPFTPDTDKNGKTKEVSDADRIKASVTAYKATIKRLKQARRSYKIKVETEQIPVDLNVGDRVRLLYDNRIFNLDACSDYFKKILSYDDWFYLTRIDYRFSGDVETNTLTLEKHLKIDRSISNQ